VGEGEVESGADGDDARGVDIVVSDVVVALDVVEVDGVSDAGMLVKIHEVALEVGVVGDAADVALEVAVVHGIETHEGAEEAPIGFHDASAEEVTAIREARVQFIERGEEREACLLVRALAGGEAGFVNAVVHAVVDEPGEFGLFVRDGDGEEIDRFVSERAEGVVEHAADIVLGVVHDATSGGVPKHGDGDAAIEVRIGGGIGFAEKVEAIIGIVAESGAIAESPAALVAHGIDDGDADGIAKAFQVADDEGATGPRARERNVKVIAAGESGVESGAIARHPIAKRIFLALELAVF